MQKDQLKSASDMLARAFEDDLFFKILVPEREEKLVKAAHFFDFTLKIGIKYGEAYTTSPNLEGITVWMPPESTNITLWRAVRCGAIPLIFRVGPRVLKIMNSADGYAERARKRLTPDRCWYLTLLGIDPNHQGKGHASALMKPMLKRIDGDGLTC
ncbi:GNAT family N-acetyltransferase [Chloroflexota bacterium]